VSNPRPRSGPWGPIAWLGGRAPARRLRLIAAVLLMLVVGVAGSASAAVLIGSRQVKDGSLTGRDLRLGTVRGSDVRDHSLTPNDFDVVPQGPVGDQGRSGDPGSDGSPGVSVVSVAVTVPATATVPFGVPCRSPAKALFGGEVFLPPQVDTMQSAPQGDGSAWDFKLRNRSSTTDQTVTLQAYCVVDR
jgi:hypothetical protein